MERAINKIIPDKTDNLVDFLKECPVFVGLNKEDLEELKMLVHPLYFQAGDTIVQEEEISTAFYIILSGRVKILMGSASGKEFIIDTRRAGETFSDLAALDGQPSFASTQAIEDTAVLAVDRENLLRLIKRNPAMVSRMAYIAGDRLRSAYNKLISLAVENVDRRLIKILLLLSSKYGNTLCFNREEIAEMVGTTIETATRTLTRLEDSGIIRRKRGKISIIDENKLTSLLG